MVVFFRKCYILPFSFSHSFALCPKPARNLAPTKCLSYLQNLSSRAFSTELRGLSRALYKIIAKSTPKTPIRIEGKVMGELTRLRHDSFGPQHLIIPFRLFHVFSTLNPNTLILEQWAMLVPKSCLPVLSLDLNPTPHLLLSA